MNTRRSFLATLFGASTAAAAVSATPAKRQFTNRIATGFCPQCGCVIDLSIKPPTNWPDVPDRLPVSCYGCDWTGWHKVDK